MADPVMTEKRKENMVRTIVTGKRAVFFDLFHTLTAPESEWLKTPVTSDVLGIPRKAWDDQLQNKSRFRLVGEIRDPYEILAMMARAVKPDIPDNLIKKAVENRIRRFESALLHIPGVNIRTLDALKKSGKKIGLISNAEPSEIIAWSKSPAAKFFDDAVFSCDVGWMKPESEIYCLAMERLGVMPDESIFVADGACRELEGAKNVGMTTVMVTGVMKELWHDEIGIRGHHADYIIEALDELI
jgi:putative hydrolase of the HAD superfamily